MKKVLIVAAIAFCAAASAAEADMRVTGTYGAWRSEEGSDDGNNPMCNAELLGGDRGLFVKAYHDVFFVHVYKDGWQIPADQRVEVALQVDDAPPMNFDGSGGSTTSTSFMIVINPDDIWKKTGQKTITELVNLLKNGRGLRLIFPDGNEPPWEGSLAGSGRALTAMMDCQRRLVVAARATEPFGATAAPALGPAAAAQPFSQVPPALPHALEVESSEGQARKTAARP
jgi:hypothetical protein